MTWVKWAGFIASNGGWFVLGILTGRRLMRREVDQAIDTVNLLRRRTENLRRS